MCVTYIRPWKLKCALKKFHKQEVWLFDVNFVAMSESMRLLEGNGMFSVSQKNFQRKLSHRFSESR